MYKGFPETMERRNVGKMLTRHGILKLTDISKLLIGLKLLKTGIYDDKCQVGASQHAFSSHFFNFINDQIME